MITEDSTAALLYARGDTATRQQPGECSFYHSKFCIQSGSCHRFFSSVVLVGLLFCGVPPKSETVWGLCMPESIL